MPDRQGRLDAARHARLAFGADVGGLRQAVRLHQQMAVLLKAGITARPIHAVFGQNLDEAGLDALDAPLARLKQAKHVRRHQGMVAQLQIRDQAAHAAAAPLRRDEMAVGSVSPQTGQMSQVLMGPEADNPFLVEVVGGGGEGGSPAVLFDQCLHGAGGRAFAADVVLLDVVLEGDEPDHRRPGTGQKVLGERMIVDGDLFQSPESIVGQGAGHNELAPDGIRW